MTTQVAILLVILLAMSICFFTELLPISFTALMVPVMLQATGILTSSHGTDCLLLAVPLHKPLLQKRSEPLSIAMRRAVQCVSH